MWQSLEASRLQPVLKDKERAQEVSQRAVDLSESFSKETEKKLQEKMDAMQEKKKAQIQALLDRLSLHVCIVLRYSLNFIAVNVVNNRRSTTAGNTGNLLEFN